MNLHPKKVAASFFLRAISLVPPFPEVLDGYQTGAGYYGVVVIGHQAVTISQSLSMGYSHEFIVRKLVALNYGFNASGVRECGLCVRIVNGRWGRQILRMNRMG
jgi:hypothetical protein